MNIHDAFFVCESSQLFVNESSVYLCAFWFVPNRSSSLPAIYFNNTLKCNGPFNGGVCFGPLANKTLKGCWKIETLGLIRNFAKDLLKVLEKI